MSLLYENGNRLLLTVIGVYVLGVGIFSMAKMKELRSAHRDFDVLMGLRVPVINQTHTTSKSHGQHDQLWLSSGYNDQKNVFLTHFWTGNSLQIFELIFIKRLRPAQLSLVMHDSIKSRRAHEPGRTSQNSDGNPAAPDAVTLSLIAWFTGT